MANYMDNLGLEFLLEDDCFTNFLALLVKEGKPIPNYHQRPHFFSYLGDTEFWVGTDPTEDGRWSVSGFDTHCCGQCIPDLVSSGIDITPDGFSPMKRRILLRKEDGSGLLPVEIINADVLPSLLEGESVKLQLIAFPSSIHYYADEEAYAAAQPADDFGKKWLIGEGSLFPSGFLANHSPGSSGKASEDESDLLIAFHAKVTRLFSGAVKLGGETIPSFIICRADTQVGTLDFLHTYDQVAEEERGMLKVGSVISGVCILSGDAVIHEYENGIVLDHDHDLRLLRDCIVRGDEERLRAVLADDAEYYPDDAGTPLKGAAEIIAALGEKRSARAAEPETCLGTVVSLPAGLSDTQPDGVRCIVFTDSEGENCESAVFIGVDEGGRIRTIRSVPAAGYRFSLERPEKGDPAPDDFAIPDDPLEPIFVRARLHGLIGEDLERGSLIEGDPDRLEHFRTASRMIRSLKAASPPDRKTALANLFGYLFAKAIEQDRLSRLGGAVQPEASLDPEDAFSGQLHTALRGEEQEKLEKALDLGKSFFNDFRFYVTANELPKGQFEEKLTIALAAVQRIGQIFSSSFLPGDQGR